MPVICDVLFQTIETNKDSEKVRHVMSLSISVKCKYKECISGFLLSHSLICFLFSKYDILILYINSLLKSGDISGFYIASTV